MNGNGGGGDGETTQWLLTAEEHASLPAFQRTTEAEEAASRYRATGLVQAIGMRLKLPQTTIATANVFLHRFYLRETFRSFAYRETAPAVVFLAAKVEEHPRKLRDVLHALLDVQREASAVGASASAGTDADAGAPAMQEERLLALEKIVLQTICFDLAITHPYRYVFRLVKRLADVPDELVQSAWIVVNDSYRTSVCVRHPPRAIATAAICYAAEKRGLDLAALAGEAISGDLVFGCPRADVADIVATIKHLYGLRPERSHPAG